MKRMGLDEAYGGNDAYGDGAIRLMGSFRRIQEEGGGCRKEEGGG